MKGYGGEGNWKSGGWKPGSHGCSCSRWRTEDTQEDSKVRVERKVTRQMSMSLMHDGWRIGGHSRAALRRGKGRINKCHGSQMSSFCF